VVTCSHLSSDLDFELAGFVPSSLRVVALRLHRKQLLFRHLTTATADCVGSVALRPALALHLSGRLADGKSCMGPSRVPARQTTTSTSTCRIFRSARPSVTSRSTLCSSSAAAAAPARSASACR
jgi:hypothetical protein